MATTRQSKYSVKIHTCGHNKHNIHCNHSAILQSIVIAKSELNQIERHVIINLKLRASTNAYTSPPNVRKLQIKSNNPDAVQKHAI